MFNKEKILKIVKIVVILLIIALAAFIVINVVLGDKDGNVFTNKNMKVSRPQNAIDVVDTTEDVSVVMAENENYKLEYNPVSDLMLLTDKATGEVFRSYPEIRDEDVVGNVLDKANPVFKIKSPVIVCYTSNGDTDDGDVGINQALNTTKEVNKIENGYQIKYTMASLNISFYVEFTIDEEGLIVTVPRNGIKEFRKGDSEARLLSVSVLPYFLSNRQGDEGFYVIPDGSGALTYFDQPRLTSATIYEKRLYGSDITFDEQLNPDYINENIMMPVAGRIIKNSMTTMYAVESEANTELVMFRPGRNNIPYYGLGYKFNFRQAYLMTMGNGETFYQYEDEFSSGDAKVKYCFSHKDEGDFTYVDMAKEVREYLLKDWNEDFGISSKENNKDNALVNVKVFLGAENKTGGVVDSFQALTTFNQVKEVYENLKKAGLDSMSISLLGWQNGGYYGGVSDKFPADKNLGGEKELIALLSWAKENKIEVSLDMNTLMMYESKFSNGITLRNPAVKKADTNYLNSKNITAAGSFGKPYNVMGPAYYMNNMMKEDIEILKEYGVNAMDLQTMGDMLYTDYNAVNAVTRQQMMHNVNSILKNYASNFNTVSVYYGHDYAVAAADRILDMPVDSSDVQLIDVQIPFIQLIYHGMVDYYCEPINRSDNEVYSFLKALETGSMLSYELTYNSTEALKYTYYDKLFKSKADSLSADIAEKYLSVADFYKSVKNETIENHFQVDESKEVYCTEYSNGVKVYVNYEASAFTSDVLGINVDANSFVILGV